MINYDQTVTFFIGFIVGNVFAWASALFAIAVYKSEVKK